MKRLLLTVLPILLALASYGQRTITGVIKDMKGDPIIGANVIAKEDITIGTITDIDGSFKLVVNQSVKNLTLSYTGYTTKEVNVENVNQISEILAEGKLLDEVVVVGYGTQKRSNLTGSISSIKGADIASSPIQSFDQGLQGRAAGVQITTPNGVLNNPPVIRIRGTNSINLSSQPLIVIDGVPTFTGNLSQTNAANNPLANINPNDIESYEILKDASASAIYGSRAAAGVILITTKKGKKGTTKVNYEGWVGTTSPMRLFDMLSGPQYLEIKNEALANNNNPARFVAGKDVSGNDISTRWYDHTHQTGTSQSHALNFSGGSDKTNFYVSLGYSEQEGFLKDNTFDRLTTRVNLDHSLTKRIKVGSSISYTNTDNKGPNSGIAGGAFSIAGLGRLPLVLAPIVSPYINAQGQGSQTLDPGFDYNLSSVNTIGFMGNTLPLSFFNPAYILEFNKFSSVNDHFIGNAYADVEIIKGLNFKTLYGIDNLSIENQSFADARHGDGNLPAGSAFNSFDKLKRWNFQNTLNYMKDIGKHDIGILLGTEQQSTIRDSWGATRTQIADPFFTTFQGNYTIINPAGNFQTENFLTSYFGRANYSYDKKYFATFNARRDGFSAFAPGKKFGNFYGGALGYTISEENFWKNNLGDKINYLKLKGSYGIVGNSGVNDFASLSLFGSGLYGPSPTLTFGQAGNSNLTWETSKKTDIGFVMGLFNDRVQTEFSYYKNDIDGLILPVPQSPSKGIPGNSVLANVGSMTNSGIEATITYNAVTKKDFSWSVNLNFTTQRNIVNALSGDGAEIASATAGLEVANLTRVGESIGNLFVVQTKGVNPANGQRIFLRRDANDANKFTEVQYNHAAPAASRWTLVSDGTPTGAVSVANSGVMQGPTIPTFFGGLSNSFRYKAFDLNIMFQYSGGNLIYNGTQAGLRDMRNWNNHTDVLDRWTPTNTTGTIPRLVWTDNVSNGSALPISENVEKGDFIRLRDLSLGFKLPTRYLSKAGIAGLRVYGQMINPLLFTNYSGSDPEISTNGDTNTAPGIDRNSVGQGRSMTFGVQVSF